MSYKHEMSKQPFEITVLFNISLPNICNSLNDKSVCPEVDNSALNTNAKYYTFIIETVCKLLVLLLIGHAIFNYFGII